MGSHETYLKIFNGTENEMRIFVACTDNNDWDGNSHPDHNFQNVTIAKNESREEREELNSNAKSAWYTMILTPVTFN